MGEGIVLVTGASGFLGARLAGRLAREGRRVRAFCRTRPSLPFPCEWIPGDVRDAAALSEAARGAETIFHAAALIPGRGSPAVMDAVNAGGSRNAASAAVTAGVRTFVHVSSVAAYAPPFGTPVGESDPLGGVGAYGCSKARSEALVREACAGRLRLAIVRPCQIYGPGDTTGFTARMLRMLAWPWLPTAGGGPRPYCLIHVDDVVEGLLAAEAGAAPAGEAYNLAGPPVSLREMARWTAPGRRQSRPVPLPDSALRLALSLRWFLKHVRDPEGAGRWRSYAPGKTEGSLLLGGPAYATAKAERELGFRPGMALREALIWEWERRSGASRANVPASAAPTVSRTTPRIPDWS